MFPSLYIHFPFCESKCHYCDFYSLGRERTKPGDPLTFLDALRAEATRWAASGELAPTLDTLFFGGGTPSLTSARDMARALAPLALERRLTSNTEWTMEANPSSVAVESLREYRAFGVNRVSMGVQAMRDDLLLRLGRVHSREAALSALDAIFTAGFDNVSVDLLCGVPGQTLDDLEEAIGRLTSFPISHLSCYLLTLPPHHRMFKELPGEDDQLAHLMFVHERLCAAGFEHYEISNYARPGREARHNLAYWKGGAYLGLGPSAHSFNGVSRWKNVSSLHRYSALLAQGSSPIEWTETLTPQQRELERWMLGLRLSEGFPSSWLATDPKRRKAAALAAAGLLEEHPITPGFHRLTPRGLALSDQVIAELA